MITASMLPVPLDADPVAPPRLLYGALAIHAPDQDDADTSLYFRTRGGGLGRVTFEDLDAVRAEGGESPPYDEIYDAADGWVYALTGSPWLQARHDYEVRNYDTPREQTHQHYVFLFHDEYIEAIAEGIWLDTPDPAHPFTPPADHPLHRLQPELPAQHFRSDTGIDWQLRRSPRSDTDLLTASTLCSQRVYQYDTTHDGDTSETASLWLRTRDGDTYSVLRSTVLGSELARHPGLATPDDVTDAWEQHLAEITERRATRNR